MFSKQLYAALFVTAAVSALPATSFAEAVAVPDEANVSQFAATRQVDSRASPRHHRGRSYGLPRSSYGLYRGTRPSLSYGCGDNGPALPPCPHGQVYGFADGWMYH